MEREISRRMGPAKRKETRLNQTHSPLESHLRHTSRNNHHPHGRLKLQQRNRLLRKRKNRLITVDTTAEEKAPAQAVATRPASPMSDRPRPIRRAQPDSNQSSPTNHHAGEN